MGRCEPHDGRSAAPQWSRLRGDPRGGGWLTLLGLQSCRPFPSPLSGRGRCCAAGVHARHHRVTAGCGAPGHGVQHQHTAAGPRRPATTGRRQQDSQPGGACPVRHSVLQGGADFWSSGSAGGACHWAGEPHCAPSECRRPRCDTPKMCTHACVGTLRSVAARVGRRHCMLQPCEARLTGY